MCKVSAARLPVCALRNLVPVTQLYVSVDASTEQSLKKIDRPLFKDFWPRFLNSLRALSEKVHYVLYLLYLNGHTVCGMDLFRNV